MNNLTICLLTAATLGLTACGGGKSDADRWARNAPKVTSPCDVITEDMVEEIFGIAFDADPGRTIDQSENGGGILGNCSYTSVDDDDPSSMADVQSILANTTYVTLRSFSWPDEESAKDLMDNLAEGVPSIESAEVIEVQSLGDQAFTTNHHLGALTVRDGTVVYTVTVTRNRRHLSDEERQIAETLLAAY